MSTSPTQNQKSGNSRGGKHLAKRSLSPEALRKNLKRRIVWIPGTLTLAGLCIAGTVLPNANADTPSTTSGSNSAVVSLASDVVKNADDNASAPVVSNGLNELKSVNALNKANQQIVEQSTKDSSDSAKASEDSAKQADDAKKQADDADKALADAQSKLDEAKAKQKDTDARAAEVEKQITEAKNNGAKVEMKDSEAKAVVTSTSDRFISLPTVKSSPGQASVAKPELARVGHDGNNMDVQVSAAISGLKYDSSKGGKIADAALAQLGTTQDCTMLVTNALKSVNVLFHGWPADYMSLGDIVPEDEAKPGDLIYYADNGMGGSHIAVYIGDGKAVHGGWHSGGLQTTAVFSAHLPTASQPIFIRVA